MLARAVVIGSGGCGGRDRCGKQVVAAVALEREGGNSSFYRRSSRGTAPPGGRTNRNVDDNAFAPKRMEARSTPRRLHACNMRLT